MKRELINVVDTIKQIAPKVLIKDLQDNERICPTCKGLSIVPVDRVYGIKGDTSPEAKQSMCPYNHQTFTFCPDCFNGVQTLCKYCGKLISKNYIDKCNCEEYKKEQEEIRLFKWKETLNKAREVFEVDVTNMLYCEETGDFYMDVEDFMKQYGAYIEAEEMPERLWVTSKMDISIDASNIIEDACSDLHEDASDNCDRKDLQELLDNWCSKQSGTSTYYPCYKEYVLLTKENCGL